MNGSPILTQRKSIREPGGEHFYGDGMTARIPVTVDGRTSDRFTPLIRHIDRFANRR